MCTQKHKKDRKKHKSNIKWMGIVHVSVSGCGPNQYVSSWSVCESVSMCVGNIAYEGVCAFSLWFVFFEFFLFEFLGGGFLLLLRYSGYVHTKKNTKRDQKKHKSNIKWMGIVHVSVSGCGPNQYMSSWLVGWLVVSRSVSWSSIVKSVGWSVSRSVGRSVSWSSIVKLVDWSVIRSVGWSVGRSVGRSVSQLVINRQVGWLVSHQVSWLVGRSVGQSVGHLFGSDGWSYV